MAEKILARHAAKKTVSPGEIVSCKVDVAVCSEILWVVPGLMKELRALWDPDKVYFIPEKFVPASDERSAQALKKFRDTAARLGVNHVYEVGRHGISHVLVVEEGIARPGMIVANSDSHTCSVGAVNCAGRGLGGPDLANVLCKGETWYLVSPTVRFILEGKLPERSYPRDIMHYIAGIYGDFSGRNIEWVGPAVREMSMAGRLTLSTMSAELSAEFALFEADEVCQQYVKSNSHEPFEPAFADPDATFEAEYPVDLSKIEPLVVLPNRVAFNVKNAREMADVKIDQAFLGSCANGRVEDIAIAAELMKGRQVAPGVRFIVTPGSEAVHREITRLGYVQTLLEAGAVVTSSTCGACAGLHMGVLAEGETCITASTRNFQGRMGSPKAQIFLGSPATVAASAIKGRITDPRDF